MGPFEIALEDKGKVSEIVGNFEVALNFTNISLMFLKILCKFYSVADDTRLFFLKSAISKKESSW